MAAYTDYAYYTTTYLGTAITATLFPAYALRASAVIDQLTFDRAASVVDVAIIDKLEMATCAIAEELQKQDITGVDAIQSESVGGHSLSYAKNSTAQMTNDQKLLKVAKLYLGSTDLLFKGFSDGEYGAIVDED
jgi:hypothetical protein